MKDRIVLLLNHIGLSVSAFEQAIGASNGSIRKAIEEGRGLNSTTIEKIVSKYPQYNYDWLIVGRGNMLLGRTIMLEQRIDGMMMELGQMRQELRLPVGHNYSNMAPTNDTTNEPTNDSKRKDH